MRPACVAIAGRIATGKTTICRLLSQRLSWFHLGLGDFLAWRLQQQGSAVTRQALQDLGLTMISSDLTGFCREALKFVHWQPSRGILIDGPRNVGIFDEFSRQTKPEPAFLIFLQLNEKERAKRLTMRTNLSLQTVRKYEKHPVEHGMVLLEKTADIVLDADRPPDQLADMIESELQNRMKHYRI